MPVSWLPWLALALQIGAAVLTARGSALASLVVPASWALAVLACVTVAAAKGYPRWLGIFCAVLGLGIGPLMVIALPTLSDADDAA
ncbi:hypothetical protein [Sandaracinus amylolyticus]|uniref:hypothetical protein n=1 Tax=Sandaracinus amylolyticus TaxID=927083 RepID=UPI001F468D77|nr:hypothetical protein [Sandaracinus amylolyticus]UJR81406.1 Hypothetical protein I5071_34640 [Sandaracinus amylolyticus]